MEWNKMQIDGKIKKEREIRTDGFMYLWTNTVTYDDEAETWN